MIMKKKNCLKYCQRKLNSCKLSLKVRIYVVLKDFKSTTLSVKVTNKAVQLSTDLHQIQDFIYLISDLRRDLLFSHQVPQFLQLSVGWVQSHVFLAGHVGCMYKLMIEIQWGLHRLLYPRMTSSIFHPQFVTQCSYLKCNIGVRRSF